jgi:hypothetical protein
MPGSVSTPSGHGVMVASSASAISDDDMLSVASSMSLIDLPSEAGSEGVPARTDAEFIVLYESSNASSNDE